MTIVEEKCYVCGRHAKFNIEASAALLREAACEFCGASIRNSDVAKLIVATMLEKDTSLAEAIDGLRDYKILGTAANGAIHSLLKKLPGYCFGEYFDDVSSGEYLNGIMSIDLKNCPFEDAFFDMVVSEDVLEHIDDVNAAFREVNRILKPQGAHIFSVPFHQNRRTLDRTYHANKVYHGDPLRPMGALVYTDFGEDIEEIIDAFGMRTERFVPHVFHAGEDITNVDADYAKYLAHEDDHLGYFQYNSFVFRAIKSRNLSNILSKKAIQGKGPEFTGERFVPDKASGEINAEHLHRYRSILELVKNKTVLDAACGEGYGSYILSQAARQVVGIDIDDVSVGYAQSKYRLHNLKYLQASINELPFASHSFDVVVSFETIEHVDERIQGNFLGEINRILKQDGILIISTPDKALYSDKVNLVNEYHVKEFYFYEFQAFLSQWFRHVDMYYQGFEVMSLLTAVRNSDNKYRLLPQPENWRINKKYIIAVCSQQSVENEDTIQSMMYQDDISFERDHFINKQTFTWQAQVISNQQELIADQQKRINFQRQLLSGYMLNLLKEKKIVFFGTGSAVNKIYAVLPVKPEYFVDNNPQKWNQDLDGRKIYPPDYLLKENKDEIIVIIASQYYKEIAAQLGELGFEENVHYWSGGNIVDL